MAVISSIFWVIGFILSVTLAPQLRIWAWGPTMICFAVSTLAALPPIWNSRNSRADLFIVISGLILVSWIALRAAVSPVAELAQSDLLLMAMAVATFICFRASAGGAVPQKILIHGLALILLASVAVIGKQILDPTFSPIFPNELPKTPAGFFAHYSYGASFLIPVSLLVAAVAIHSKNHWITRILLGSVALAGMVAVYFTNSRGGFIGIGTGFVTLCALSIFSGHRQDKKWFGPAVILFPLILIALALFFLSGLSAMQENRSGQGDMAGMLDNSIRLYLLEIAVSCFAAHPLFGGGSRSFSWECFQYWDTQAMGKGSARPEHVHNELIQTACEYGAVGAGLLIVFLVGVVIVAISRVASRTPGLRATFSDSWRIGGVAGLVGLFAQSNFEGIFRIPPGAILLGLCIAAACFPSIQTRNGSTRHLSNGVTSLAGLGVVALLALFGWKGSLASAKLWPAYFSRIPPGLETRASAVSEGIAIWPLGSLHRERGGLYQKMASQCTSTDEVSELLGLALLDFRKAEELNPYDPEHAIGSAILLSALDRDKEAEITFNRAISIQGEMEAAFQSHSLLAKHLYSKGITEFSDKKTQLALNSFQLAAAHIDKVAELYGDGLLSRDQQAMRVGVHESWGQVLEELGDPKGAIEQYDFASTLRSGPTAHYRAGVLLGKMAVLAWSERRSADALALFMAADSRTKKAHQLPAGIDANKRAEYLAYLKKTIAYLKGAKIEPSINPDF